MIAFYTCFIGGDMNWANVITELPSTQDDCYYFTNNPSMYSRLEHTGWKRVWLDIPIENDNILDCANTKSLRCRPHLYEVLRPYEYVCWIDSKLRVTDLKKVYEMRDSLVGSKVIAITRHPYTYLDAWGEYNEAIKHAKYASQKDQYHNYIVSKLSEGFENKPLRHSCGFSVRKQCSLFQEIGETWYTHIQECGIEDQISWQFVVQLFPDAIQEFDYQYCWTYF